MDWLSSHWDEIMTILNAIGLVLVSKKKVEK